MPGKPDRAISLQAGQLIRIFSFEIKNKPSGLKFKFIRKEIYLSPGLEGSPEGRRLNSLALSSALFILEPACL